MTDKEYLQDVLDYITDEYGWPEEDLHRLQSIIDNMPDKERLLESTLKHIDKLCEGRNVKFAEESSYKVDSILSDELLFSPSIKASNV